MSLRLPKALSETRVRGPEFEGSIKKALEQAKVHELKSFKSMEDLKVDLKELDRLKVDVRELKGLEVPHFALRSDGEAQIEASLSKEQRTLHQKQGHLKTSDLTPAQQKMLGKLNDAGNWTISVTRDGKTLTIRGG